MRLINQLGIYTRAKILYLFINYNTDLLFWLNEIEYLQTLIVAFVEFIFGLNAEHIIAYRI